MRRNIQGGHRGGQNWQSSQRISGGRPSMVADLGLQDIDKELELLQRKREIIEQQQQILSNEFRGRNEYDDSYRQSSRFDEFASSYNDRPYNPPSRKRPIPVWEDNVPTKRFSGPVRSRTQNYTRPAPPPLMGSGSVYQHRPVRPSGPFRPKPSRKSPAITAKAPLSSRPKPTERQKVPEPVATPRALPDELNRLCPDREPTKQVRGRLELALGSIIKQIRLADPDSIKAPAVIRDVKSVIRERIREIMMGRVVGTSDSIIARYREVYDKQTDAELVANSVRAQQSGDVAPFKIEDPEKYFKVNLQRLMQLKLKKLLDQLEEAARAEYKTDEKKNDSDNVTETKVPDEDDEADKTPLDENITNTEKFKSLEKWMSGRMTIMIKKYLPFFIKLMDIDTKYSRLKNLITSETVKMLVEKDGQQITDMIEAVPNESQQNTTPKNQNTPNKPLPYYAKLLGKPGLPRRNQMESFFEQYGPKSIKKHRTVHNLLFVGFNDKECFEQFLAADGTVIGKHTLGIRVSDRAKTESSQPKQELNSSITSEDKLIGSELDEQITDLLSSIRKAEEEDTDVKGAGVEEDKTDIKTEGGDVEIKGDDDKIEEDVENNGNEEKTDENSVKTEDININNQENDDATNIDNGENAGNADVNMEENAENLDTNTDEANDDANAVTESTENGSREIKKEENGTEETEEVDEIKPLLDNKPTGRSTPVRASNRIVATPSRIQTRRASRLAQNDA